MHEILFRGKDVYTGEWVYGFYVHLDGGKRESHRIYTGQTEVDCGDFYPDWFEVDASTVGRYTGLTDKDGKNGKRIFEGDIIECWSEGVCAKGEVQQRKDGMWIIYPAWQKEIMWGLCPDEYGNTAVRVIGNIHDNPELMEGKEDK